MTIRVIVNADDYGYFSCVSRGIIEAAHAGALSATGILATRPDLNTQLAWLNAVPQLELGVHLNLTIGQPLTEAMRIKLARWQGCFPNAYTMSGLIMSGKISLAVVRAEWCAQIEACQPKKLVFLNSHEHIHMLPVLFLLVVELADVYNIAHVRLTQAEWLKPLTGAGLIRNTLMQAMQLLNQRHLKTPAPLFLGLNHSGKLTYDALSVMFSTVQAGQCYELMCHVGRFDANEITDPKLLAYHDWEAELALLQSPAVQELYQRFNIRLSHYHQI